MKKLLVLLMVIIGFAGCSLLSEEVIRDPLTVSLGKERGDPEIACTNVLSYVKRSIIEEMPSDLTQEQAEFTFNKSHYLIGMWRSNNGYCHVYDIKSMETFGPHQSPSEILEERLHQEQARGELKSFKFAGNGSYVILTI